MKDYIKDHEDNYLTLNEDVKINKEMSTLTIKDTEHRIVSNSIFDGGVIGHDVKMEVSEWLVNQLSERLLKKVDFVNFIRDGDTVPFDETDLGEKLDSKLKFFEKRVEMMETKVDKALKKIDLFLQGFSLPD